MDSESYEVEGAGESRTCVLGDQADLWVSQSPIPGTGEEDPLAADQLRIGESVCGATAALGRDVGNVCLGAGNRTVGGPHNKGFGAAVTYRIGSDDQLRNRFASGTVN